ncbi:hypothetical protein P3S67_008014 [Capsicum chacoense]
MLFQNIFSAQFLSEIQFLFPFRSVDFTFSEHFYQMDRLIDEVYDGSSSSFSVWQQKFLDALKQQKRIGYQKFIDGTVLVPTDENSFTYAVWKKHNSTVFNWIVNSVSDEIRAVIANEKLETARDLWIFLESNCALKSGSMLLMEFNECLQVFELAKGTFDAKVDTPRNCILSFDGKGRFLEEFDENKLKFMVFEFENNVKMDIESDVMENLKRLGRAERRRSTGGIGCGWDNLLPKYNRHREIKDFSRYAFGGVSTGFGKAGNTVEEDAKEDAEDAGNVEDDAEDAGNVEDDAEEEELRTQPPSPPITTHDSP